MFLCIDPSFTACGIAVTDNSAEEVIYTKKVKTDLPVYDDIVKTHRGCRDILNQLAAAIEEVFKQTGERQFKATIVEYPALATRSGAYLAILNGMLAQFFNDPLFGEVVWLPPMACNAYIGNKGKTKSFIVDWAKQNFDIPKKRISNDECTGLVFSKILYDILHDKYKKSYFIADEEMKESPDAWIP